MSSLNGPDPATQHLIKNEEAVQSPRSVILNKLCRCIEREPGHPGVVIFLAKDNTLRVGGAGQRVSQKLLNVLNGMRIGPQSASCGTAVHRQAPVIVTDMGQDPLWKDYRGVLANQNFRSSWAIPLASKSRSCVAGTLSLFFSDHRRPECHDMEAFHQWGHLVEAVLGKAEKAEIWLAPKAPEPQTNEEVEHSKKLDVRMNNSFTTVSQGSKTDAGSEDDAKGLAMLSRIAAEVAHELNNPLSNVKNAFELIKTAVPPTHPNFPYIGLIDREINRMKRIVNQMYQLYAGREIIREVINLECLLQDTIALFTTQLSQKHISMIMDIPPAFPLLSLPKTELTQILCNLLHNAIEASPLGRAITMSVQHRGENLRLGVSDMGTGIPAELLERIFHPFFTTKRLHQKSNMGLGLCISNSLVQAMGGKIEVNTTEGKGTTFTVVLPWDDKMLA